MEFFDIKQQYRLYKPQIDAAIQQVLNHGQFIMGPEVKQLELALADFAGVQHCIAVSSGTDSLLIALMALGIKSQDEVISVPFSWISSTEVISLAGAIPVFVDIDPETYNLDPSKLEEAITPRTRAIIAVNLFGQMADYTRINAIAAKYGIPVIEDAAQSFGASQEGCMSCSATLIGSTSFFPSKPLGCYGDGGALFTNDAQLAAKMRAIRTHGGEQRHHHPYLGMNGRLDTLQAAILLAKLPQLTEEIAARQRIGKRYAELLSSCCCVPTLLNGNSHVYAQYTIRAPNREKLQQKLLAAGIPTAVYYPKCIHLQPVFAHLGYKKGSMPISEQAAEEVLSLPMHPWLTDEDLDRIANVIHLPLLRSAL